MFVYMMQSESGEVKIGKAICPEERAYQVSKVFNTNIIDLIYVRCGDYASRVEAVCHKWFRAFRLSNEWFAIMPCQAIAAIRSAKSFCQTHNGLSQRSFYNTVNKYGVEFQVRFPFEKNRGKASK